MREPVQPGFSLMPHLKKDFKDGIAFERKRVVDILKKEQERTKLGFIQYKTILELLGESND